MPSMENVRKKLLKFNEFVYIQEMDLLSESKEPHTALKCVLVWVAL